MTTPLPDVDDLRHRADNIEWASAGNPWDYDPDAAPDSAYAEWVRLLSPATVVALIDRLERPELDEERLAAALDAVWRRMQRGDMDAGGPNGVDMRRRWARSLIEHYQTAGVAPTTVGNHRGDR